MENSGQQPSTDSNVARLKPLLYALVLVLFGLGVYFLAAQKGNNIVDTASQQQITNPLAGITAELSNPDPQVRINAINKLADLNSLDATKTLLSVVEDADPQVISSLKGALSSVTNKYAINWLTGDGLTFPNPAVRTLVTEILPSLKGVNAVPFLVKQLSDPDDGVRIAAIGAIDRTDTPDTVNALVKGLTDANWAIREAAIKGIGSRKSLDTYKALVENCGTFPTGQFEFWMIQQYVFKTTPETVRYLSEVAIRSQNNNAQFLAFTGLAQAELDDPDRILEILLELDVKGSRDLIAFIRAIGEIASRPEKVSPEMATRVYDRLMIYVNSGSDELRLAAAEAISDISTVQESILLKLISVYDMPIVDWRVRGLINPSIMTHMDTVLIDSKGRKLDLSYNAWMEYKYSKDKPPYIPDILGARFNRTPGIFIQSGLNWLLRHQEADGRWSCAKHNPYNEQIPLPGFSFEDEAVDAAVTGLAAMCFMGEGQTHKYGLYQEPVKKALEYIISCQTDEGSINFEKGHVHSHRCLSMGEGHGSIPTRYNHNIGTLALVEAYAMTKDEWLKPHAQKALDWAHETREPDYDWSYFLEPTDIGPSAFYMTALEVARGTDLKIAEDDHKGARTYMRFLTDMQSGRIIHICDIPWCFGGYDSTATGVFMRALHGSGADDPAQRKAIEFLKPHAPEWNVRFVMPKVMKDITLIKGDVLNFWHWYYGTLAFLHAGTKEEWNDWKNKVTAQLARHQRVGGDMDGSWDPEGAWCGAGGRVYSTAFAIMTLQAEYSYTITK